MALLLPLNAYWHCGCAGLPYCRLDVHLESVATDMSSAVKGTSHHRCLDERMESTTLRHFYVSFLWQNQHSGGAGLPHCYLGVGLSSATPRHYFSATPSHKLTLHSYGLSLVTPWCTSRVRTASTLLQRRAGGASPWPYCYHSMHTGIVAM